LLGQCTGQVQLSVFPTREPLYAKSIDREIEKVICVAAL
jgi:hypothetical protein